MSLLHRLAVAVSVNLLILGSAGAEKLDFDFYVFAMSYQPEFCYAKRSENFEGCHHPRDFWKTHLTIHGLWPERRDGSWPATCSKEPLDENVVHELQKDLDLYWPNIKDEERDDPHYTDFWKHEWSKHGTCSGLDQKSYFQAALEHFIDTPDIVGQNYGKKVSKFDLLEAYDNNVVLVCSKQRYLEEVRACYGMDPDGRPTTLVPCPPPVLSEASCGDEIIISKFPDDHSRSGNLRVASS